MEFLTEYGVFLAKAVTIVVAVLFIIAAAAGAAGKNKTGNSKDMVVVKLNDKLDDVKAEIEDAILDKETLKARKKALKKKEKLSRESCLTTITVETLQKWVLARLFKDQVTVKTLG